MKSLYFLTCSKYPQGTDDDRLLVKPLKERGIDVHFIDWQDSNLLSKVGNDLVVVRSPWNYLEDKEAFLKACHKLPWLLNSSELIEWNIHKSYLFELEQLGLSIIPSFPLEQFDFRGTPFEKVVVKPYVSASSFETVVCHADALPDEVKRWRDSNPQNYFVQPYCSSIIDEGERSFIFFKSSKGPTFSHAAIKTPKKDDFRVQEEFGGTTVSFNPSSTEVEQAESFCLSLENKSWLYARVDLVLYENKWCLGELEVIEPDLYFRTAPKGILMLAEALSHLIKSREN